MAASPEPDDPAVEAIDPPARDAVARRFRELVEVWQRETEHESSPTTLFMHSAYQQIIGLGPDVLPVLLNDLERTGRNWFWALRAITGENPVPSEERGELSRMIAHWLEWGRVRGLVQRQEVNPPA
ncbi:MAG TPA: hypothetical protein VF746_09665 [Longimicrobium sp.]|jgi:hypothetical protein